MHDPRLSRLMDEGLTYDVYPPANVHVPDLEDQLGGYSLLTFLTHVDQGHGGGICITLINIRLFTIAEVLINNILVEQNSAIVGGNTS